MPRSIVRQLIAIIYYGLALACFISSYLATKQDYGAAIYLLVLGIYLDRTGDQHANTTKGPA